MHVEVLVNSFQTGPTELLDAEDAAAASLPARYPHDGTTSVYLGQYRACDLYFDAQGGLLPTVIARTGEGADYVSGLALAQHVPALATARRLAEARGLLTRQFVLDGRAIDTVIVALERRITERQRARGTTVDHDTDLKIRKEIDYLCGLERKLRNVPGAALEPPASETAS